MAWSKGIKKRCQKCRRWITSKKDGEPWAHFPAGAHSYCDGTFGIKHDHPEKFCQKCGGDNPTWYADNELFNRINGSPNGIICPVCFQKMCDAAGLSVIFKAEII